MGHTTASAETCGPREGRARRTNAKSFPAGEGVLLDGTVDFRAHSTRTHTFGGFVRTRRDAFRSGVSVEACDLAYAAANGWSWTPVLELEATGARSTRPIAAPKAPHRPRASGAPPRPRRGAILAQNGRRPQEPKLSARGVSAAARQPKRRISPQRSGRGKACEGAMSSKPPRRSARLADDGEAASIAVRMSRSQGRSA